MLHIPSKSLPYFVKVVFVVIPLYNFVSNIVSVSIALIFNPKIQPLWTIIYDCTVKLVQLLNQGVHDLEQLKSSTTLKSSQARKSILLSFHRASTFILIILEPYFRFLPGFLSFFVCLVGRHTHTQTVGTRVFCAVLPLGGCLNSSQEKTHFLPSPSQKQESLQAHTQAIHILPWQMEDDAPPLCKKSGHFLIYTRFLSRSIHLNRSASTKAEIYT